MAVVRLASGAAAAVAAAAGHDVDRRPTAELSRPCLLTSCTRTRAGFQGSTCNLPVACPELCMHNKSAGVQSSTKHGSNNLPEPCSPAVPMLRNACCASQAESPPRSPSRRLLGHSIPRSCWNQNMACKATQQTCR